jgi:hypothetical protein
MRWLRSVHKIFKPNCQCMVCEEPRCTMCMKLEELLDAEKREKIMLLTIIRNDTLPPPNIQQDELPQPIMPKVVPWRVAQAKLEREDRELAEEARKRTQSVEDAATKKRIDELEKELSIPVEK